MSAISDRLGLSKPLVTQHVNRLVADGYCERSADPADRRIIYIEATPKGTAYAREVSDYFQERGVKALSFLSPEELERFCASMQTLHELLSGLAVRPAADPTKSKEKNE